MAYQPFPLVSTTTCALTIPHCHIELDDHVAFRGSSVRWVMCVSWWGDTSIGWAASLRAVIERTHGRGVPFVACTLVSTTGCYVISADYATASRILLTPDA